MEAKISKRPSSFKSQPKVFKLLLKFLLNGSTKVLFLIFEILSFWFLENFCNSSLIPMGPLHGTLWEQKLQNSTPPSNCFWIFQTSPQFSSHSVLDIWNFEFAIFHNFFLWKFYHCHIGKPKTFTVSKRSHYRAKQSKNLGLKGK